MSRYTRAEIGYLSTQRLGRLATVTAAGDPHVVPVAYHYNPGLETIDIVGRGMSSTVKYGNIVRSGRAAFVIDEIVSYQPYRPRGVLIRGRAEVDLLEPNHELVTRLGVAREMVRIVAERVQAWGLAEDPLEVSRRVVGRPGSERVWREAPVEN